MKVFTEYDDHVRKAVRAKLGLASGGKLPEERMTEILALCATYEKEGVPKVRAGWHGKRMLLAHRGALHSRCCSLPQGGEVSAEAPSAHRMPNKAPARATPASVPGLFKPPRAEPPKADKPHRASHNTVNGALTLNVGGVEVSFLHHSQIFLQHP